MIVIEGPAIIFYGPAFCAEPTATTSGSSTYADTIDQKLGITESGVQVSIQNNVMPVNTDDMGGTEGFPAEYINMAATGSIRGTLVDYDAGGTGDKWKTVSENLELGLFRLDRSLDTTQTPNIGESYFGKHHGFSLKIAGNSASFIFPRCSLLDSPREFTLSTGVKKTTFSFTAYPIFEFAIVDGVNSCTKAFLYRKYEGGAEFAGCHDAIGGYETTANANRQFNR